MLTFVLCVISEGLSLALVKGTVVPGGLIVKKKLLGFVPYLPSVL